jgi:hypothetical protein
VFPPERSVLDEHEVSLLYPNYDSCSQFETVLRNACSARIDFWVLKVGLVTKRRTANPPRSLRQRNQGQKTVPIWVRTRTSIVGTTVYMPDMREALGTQARPSTRDTGGRAGLPGLVCRLKGIYALKGMCRTYASEGIY